MKKKLMTVTVLFCTVILAVTGIFYLLGKQSVSREKKAEQILALNEIAQLSEAGEQEQVALKVQTLQEDLRIVQDGTGNHLGLFLLCGICIVFVVGVFGYVYVAILRPFDKMKGFADKIAQGNFDVPLEYERSNYFGAFTWAFDSMRKEITKARACEKEAIENNKTVIATLSHDIKTPIASIRAYAEGLEANLDSTPEKRQKYLQVITKKCDEVSKLTNDLFLHSLSDLDKLKMNPQTFELCCFMETALTELTGAGQDIEFQKPDFSAMVFADENRLLQIVENIINNARKYAKTKITVSMSQSNDSAGESQQEDTAKIIFRDYGSGIPDEDMPFIFDKFYRGKNCGHEQGSGLGLYIVKYIAEQMGGEILLQNSSDGLEVVLILPIVSFQTS